MRITQAQADQWLDCDLMLASSVINAWVSTELDQGQFDALVDFVHNIGVGAFIKSSLLHYLNSGQLERAAAELPKWDHVDGKELAGLLDRRLAEQAVFQEPWSGDYFLEGV